MRNERVFKTTGTKSLRLKKAENQQKQVLFQPVVQPTDVPGYLLGVQHKYSNRFVQRVVNLSQQGKTEPTTRLDIAQAIQKILNDEQMLHSDMNLQSKHLNRSLYMHTLTALPNIFSKQKGNNLSNSKGRTLVHQKSTQILPLDSNQIQPKKAQSAQSLGPKLYREIASGFVNDSIRGFGTGFWYRVYQTNPGVDRNRLYNDLENLYGGGRFQIFSPKIKRFLGLNIPWDYGQFIALYPSRESREPIDTTLLEWFEKGIVTPSELARPSITSGFKEREDEASEKLSATARGFVNDWGDWTIHGLNQFLDEIPLETNNDVGNALMVLGNLVWALTAFIPIASTAIQAVVGVASLAGALTSSLASLGGNYSDKNKVKEAIRKPEITAIGDAQGVFDKPEPKSSILITVLMKAQERGLNPAAREAVLWNHLFTIPYEPSGTRQNRIKLSAYYNLRRKYPSQSRHR